MEASTVSEYTQGPWKHMGKGLLSNARESEVVGTFHSRNKANSCLIVAAPDLLEAAKEMVSSIAWSPTFDRALAKLREAIAKAEGRA